MQKILPLREEGQSRRHMQRAVEQILARGFAEIEIAPSIIAENLEPIRTGMRRITEDPKLGALLPIQIVHTDEVGWNMEAGLVRRSGKDETGNREEKFFFHFVSQMKWPNPQEGKEIFNFLLACEKINFAARRIALSVAEEMDSIRGTAFPPPRPLAGAIQSSYAVTRVLRYLKTDTAASAYTHLDRSVVTVHWWASHPGLIILDPANNHHRVAESAWNRVAIFPGKKFGGFYKGRYGPGTLHGVRDRRTAADANDDRYSLVSFIHAKLTPDEARWIKDNTGHMDALEREHAL